MLKRAAMPKYKTLRATQREFSGAAQHVSLELRLTADEHHLLIALKDEETLKKTPEKESAKKIVKKVALIRASHPHSSMTFFMLIAPPTSKKVHNKPQGEPHVLGKTTTLSAMMERVGRVENKVAQVEERLSLLEGSCSTINGSI